MKKMMIRMMSLLLAICMVTSMMPQPTYAADRPAAASASTTKAAKLKTPALPKLANVNGGIKITWSKVKGAAKYRILYKTGNGKWKKLADTTKTSYTWKKAKNGTKYSFTVRCITKNGKKYTSAYNTKGLKIKCVLAKAQEGSASAEKKPESKPDTTEQVAKPTLAVPELYSATTISNTKVKVTWGAVKGASKYRVYYKTGNGDWAKAGDTTGTSYEVTGLKAGTTYVFTVKCLATSSAEASGYNKYGMMAETTAADVTETDTAEGGTSGGSTQPTEPTQPTQPSEPTQPKEPTHPTQEEIEAEKKAKEQAAKWKAAWTNLYNLCGSVSDWTGGYGSESFLLLDDDVFNRLQKARAVGGDLQFNWRNRTTGTDAEIAEMDAAAKELQTAWDLAKKPESRAKFDPSKLVYYKTESKKLHEMFNEYRVQNGRETTEWNDTPADYARVQSSYNVIAATFVPQKARSSNFSTGSHWQLQIGTGVGTENEAQLAQYAFDAFINSPPHRTNILDAGDIGAYEGVSIVGYRHHGTNTIACVAGQGFDADSCNPEYGFNYTWSIHDYATCAIPAIWYEDIQGVCGVTGITCDAVKNCTVK